MHSPSIGFRPAISAHFGQPKDAGFHLERTQVKISTIAIVPPLLSGFVYAYHPATQGSSPKHTINAFIISSQIGALFVL